MEAAYDEPWQRVEAFRSLIRKKSRKVKGSYRPGAGTGILDIAAVLGSDLPKKGALKKEKRLAEGMWG